MMRKEDERFLEEWTDARMRGFPTEPAMPGDPDYLTDEEFERDWQKIQRMVKRDRRNRIAASIGASVIAFAVMALSSGYVALSAFVAVLAAIALILKMKRPRG